MTTNNYYLSEMFFVKETPYSVSALERVMLKVWNRHQKGYDL